MHDSTEHRTVSPDDFDKLRRQMLRFLGDILPGQKEVFSSALSATGDFEFFEDIRSKFSGKIDRMLEAGQYHAAQEMAALLLSRHPLNKYAALEMLRILLESRELGHAYAIGKTYLQIFREDAELMPVLAEALLHIASASKDALALGLLEGASLYAPDNESIRKKLEEVKERLGVHPFSPGSKAIWYVTDCFGYGEGGVNGVSQAKSMTLSSLLHGGKGVAVSVLTPLRPNLPEALADFSTFLVSTAKGKPFYWADWIPTSTLPGPPFTNAENENASLLTGGRPLKPLETTPSCLIVEGVRLDGHKYFESLHIKSSAPKVFVHHTSPDQFNDTYTDSNMLTETLAALSGYDCCVSVSANVIDEWKALGDLSQKRWEYIPNCAREEEAEEFLRSKQSVLRKKLGLPQNSFIGICLASVQMRKGQDILLAQLHKVLHFLPDAFFLFVGPVLMEWGGAQMVQYARNNFSSERVAFIGAKKNALEYLYAADCLILPSREEALPLTILEAMALGKPCIASDVNGIPELVVPEETGLLFSHDEPRMLAQHIIFLGENMQAAREMGVAGQKRYHEVFSRERHHNRWSETIQSLLRTT